MVENWWNPLKYWGYLENCWFPQRSVHLMRLLIFDCPFCKNLTIKIPIFSILNAINPLPLKEPKHIVTQFNGYALINRAISDPKIETKNWAGSSDNLRYFLVWNESQTANKWIFYNQLDESFLLALEFVIISICTHK
jgi:hypothetical protein